VYCEPAQLAAALRASREAGEITEELALLALRIFDRYSRSGRWQSVRLAVRQDARGRYSERLMDCWRDIDPAGNPFAVLTQRARYALLMELRSISTETRKRAVLAEAVKGVGQYTPEPQWGHVWPGERNDPTHK